MSQQIVVHISPIGDVTVDAQGFQGTACEQATEEIELVLGAGARKKDKSTKPEYHSGIGTDVKDKLVF